MTVDTARARAGAPAQAAPTPAGRIPIITAVACAGIFVGYLPIMAGTVGLSSIARATSASSTDLEWVVSMLVLPMAALILAFGAWGERLGRRRVLIAGLLFAMAGGVTAVCAGFVGAEHAIVLVWAGQGLAGVGAAALIPSTLALISAAEPDHRRRVLLIAAWSAAMMAAMAVGAYLSAGILAAHSWNWLFLPVAVAAGLVLILGVPFIPESRAATTGRLDVPGQILTAVGVAALVYGVIVGGSDGYSDPKAVTGLVVAAIAIGGFVAVELRTDNPLLDLHVFGNLDFSMSALVAAVAMFAYLGVNFGLALYFSALQYSPLQVADRYIFLIGGSVIGSNLAGQALRRWNAQGVLAVACLWTGVGMLVVASLDGNAPAWESDARLVIVGIGIGSVLATVTAAAVNAVPHRQAGMASAAINAVRQTGGALGPAVFSILSASWALSAVGGALADHGITGPAAEAVDRMVEQGGVQRAGAIAGARFPDLPVVDALGAAQSHGFGMTAIAAAVVFLVLGIGCLALRAVSARRDTAVPEPVSLP